MEFWRPCAVVDLMADGAKPRPISPERIRPHCARAIGSPDRLLADLHKRVLIAALSGRGCRSHEQLLSRAKYSFIFLPLLRNGNRTLKGDKSFNAFVYTTKIL
jgi:hypothetical protein